MTASYAPVDLNHRLILLLNGKFQPVANAMPGGAADGGIHRISAPDHGPFLPKEEVGPCQRCLPQ